MAIGLAMAMDGVVQWESLVLDGVMQEVDLMVAMDGVAHPDLQSRPMMMALFMPTRGTQSCSASRCVSCGSLPRPG